LQENWRQDPGKPQDEAAPNPWRKEEVHRHDGVSCDFSFLRR
jgi:hypothetical protein